MNCPGCSSFVQHVCMYTASRGSHDAATGPSHSWNPIEGSQDCCKQIRSSTTGYRKILRAREPVQSGPITLWHSGDKHRGVQEYQHWHSLMLWYRNWLQPTTIVFNLFKVYISSVESPCTVDSTSSNLRLLHWLDIGIVSTLPCFLNSLLWGYQTLFDFFWVLPCILTYDIQSPREDTVRLVLLLGEHTSY
jgi:hypothetical protein